MSINSGQEFYADFGAYSKMRTQAQANPRDPEVLRQVAGQFEALFLQMMFKNMRKASVGEGLFDSDQTKFYQEMWDTQISKDLATGPHGGIGLADVLVRQMTGQPVGGSRAGNLSLTGLNSVLSNLHTRSARGAEGGDVSIPADWRPESPEEFLATLRPFAEKAAGELGVAPDVLLAQAALETGWGRAVSRHPDGSSSHNLFNIKADGRWDGERVAVSTLEYDSGVPRRERALFRSYGSFAESFKDYVEFLRGNPRYGDALSKAGDPAAFLQALQDAGYATDPAYAEKIGAILARDEMKGTAARLNTDTAQPLS